MATAVRRVVITLVGLLTLGVAGVVLGQSYLLPGTIYDQEKQFFLNGQWCNYYYDPGNVGYQPGDQIDNTIWQQPGGAPAGWRHAEDNSCWMASAANMLRYIGGPDDYRYWAYDHGVLCGVQWRYWPTGGFQDNALNYAGYYTNSDIACNDDGTPSGLWSNPQGLVDTIRNSLSEAMPVGIGIFNDGGMKHAITVVGIDTFQHTLVVTDSDDGRMGRKRTSTPWSEASCS